MLIDITLKVTADILRRQNEKNGALLTGHLGTHFDVMNKEFPLEYTERRGIVFDVKAVQGRDIDITDVDMDKVEEGMFVAFSTGHLERTGYGTPEYSKDHPQLSHELIRALVEKGVSIIGIDFLGARRGSEHTPTDQYCADHGTFIIENLVNLSTLPKEEFTACTYPMNYEGMTGLPCRVVAKV